MDERKELYQKMKASREINQIEDTPNWRRAFDLYHAATGVRLRVKDFCSKCFNKVAEWLAA
jgi:hypothetical protein